MGFFSGRVTFARYRVQGPSPNRFGPEHLERLQGHAIGRQRVATSDGVEVGWIAGDHILDTSFDLAGTPYDDLGYYHDGVATRSFVKNVDEKFIPRALKVYANSQNVAARMLRFNKIRKTIAQFLSDFLMIPTPLTSE